MKCDSRYSLSAHIFASPCLGHKPKARVVIGSNTNIKDEVNLCELVDIPLLQVLKSKYLSALNYF